MKEIAFIKTEYLDKEGKVIFSRGEAISQSYQNSGEHPEGTKTTFVRCPYELESQISFSAPCLEIVKAEGHYSALLRLQIHPKEAIGKARLVMCRIQNDHLLTLASGQEVLLAMEY